jgi:hypothetical protein
MYATIRNYTDSDLADALVSRENDVKSVIRGVERVSAYYLVRTEEGTTSITVCDDEAAAEETNRAAAGWIRENLPERAGAPPQISAGEVVIDL